MGKVAQPTNERKHLVAQVEVDDLTYTAHFTIEITLHLDDTLIGVVVHRVEDADGVEIHTLTDRQWFCIDRQLAELAVGALGHFGAKVDLVCIDPVANGWVWKDGQP